MKVTIIDDDSMIVEALKIILNNENDIEVIGVGKDANDAVRLYKTLKPDIVIMDIRMGEKTGLDAGKEILSIYNNAKILYLTTFLDEEYIIKALKIGAKGYILKQDFSSLPNSLRAIMSGQIVFGKDIAYKFSDLIKGENAKVDINKFNLTDKDIEMIKLVSLGMSNKEIAQKVFLSEGTVRNYISQILDKLDLRDRTQLVVFYYKNIQSI